MPLRSPATGLAKLELIAAEEMPRLAQPPVNPTVEQAMQAWMAMAQAFGSIVMREHEFEAAAIQAFRDLTGAVDALRETVEHLRDELLTAVPGDETRLVEIPGPAGQ